MVIFFYTVVAYILFVFVLSRFVIPHLGFMEEKVPESIPESMMDKINQLKNQSQNQEQFLNSAYNFLGSRYCSQRFNTLLKFNYLFKSFEEVWQMEGYIPCTINNYLLKIFLIKGGYFSETDIKCCHVFANFVPHQYLRVKMNNKWLNVDVGEKGRGLPIGKYLKYFG